MVGSQPVEARDIINAALKTPSIDLIPVLEAVETEKSQVSIELAGSNGTQKTRLTVQAAGPGPLHRWVVFSLLNPDAFPRDLVIVSPHQSFVASGLIWPKRQGSRLYSVSTSAGLDMTNLRALGADALGFTMAPNSSQTFALELTSAGLSDLTLWQRSAFAAQDSEFAFFRGVILGIAMLLGIAIVSFFIARQKAVFLAAALFAWSSVAFLAIEAGYLPLIAGWLPLGSEGGQQIRAFVESLMLAGLLSCLVSLLELRRRMPPLGNGLAVLAGLAGLLAVFGFYQPAAVSGTARLLFGLVAVLGYALIFMLWREGGTRARASMFTWSILLVWTVVAAVAVLDILPWAGARLIIAAGLALVLLTLGFTLAQFAFSHGILSSRFYEDSGRRALALAGAEQTVWDWQADRGALYVGPELERALGLEAGAVTGRGLKSWIELVHPGDRAAYVAAVEAAERRGRGTFSQEFRLRRHDGTYRWYLLRARAVVGPDGRASRCIGTLADITGRKRSEDRLLSDAVRDRVTGLPNRALFADRLEVAMRRAHMENNRELYVIVIDLDRFKTVNEGLGFEAGDSLLSVTARRLAGLIGPEDTLARLPGDQFAVIFNGKKPKRDVIPFTEQLRGALSRPIRLRNRELFLTASYGVARFVDDPASAEDFAKDAEIALYEAKRRGRDSIEFFRQEMRSERSELLNLEQDLRKAIERSEIEVLFQPIARLADTQLAGFEALIRWRHRTAGLLAPDAFRALAEETGVIKDLNRQVLNEAARQLGIWQRAFRPEKPLFVSVSLSSMQLLGADLVEDMRSLLGREDIIPGTLKLEVTETLVMENPELTIEILERLRGLGIGLVCDDFGTGYSALASLRRMPFDTIKMDKSFLEADPEDEKAMIILETIILLAHDLRLDVIAEGIEGEDQRSRLAELECDFGQGFFFGEPMSAKQVVEALGGSGYLGSKPGLAGFWDRVTTRRPVPAARPASALAAPDADASPPDTVDLPQPPVVIFQPSSPISAPVASRGNGSQAEAVKPPSEAEPYEPDAESDLIAASARTNPTTHLGSESKPLRPPARSFKTTLSLPEPNAPPPRRPADIFGLTPPSTHSPAPRPGTAVPAPRIAKAPDKTTELPTRKKPQADPLSEIVVEEGSSGPDNQEPITAGDIHAPTPEAPAAAASKPDEEAIVAEELPPAAPFEEFAVPVNPDAEEVEQPGQPVEAGSEPKARLGQILRKAGKKKTRSRPN